MEIRRVRVAKVKMARPGCLFLTLADPGLVHGEQAVIGSQCKYLSIGFRTDDRVL